MKHHKSIRISILFMITASIHTFGQNIDSLFINMPFNLNPTCTSKKRFELLEYYKIRHTDSIQNNFGGFARIISRDSINQQILFQTTSATSIELMIFKKSNNEQFIGCIQTIHGPVEKSVIHFFDTNWKPMSIKFRTPSGENWLNLDSVKSSGQDNKWVSSIVYDDFTSMKFNPVNKTIQIKNNLINFLSDDNKKIITPLLKTSILEYKYENSHWELTENPHKTP